MTGNNQQVADPRAYVGLGDCCNPRGRGLDEDGGDQDATHGDLSVRSVREGCPRSEIPQSKERGMVKSEVTLPRFHANKLLR